jgi:hypothetical protein
MHLPDPVLFSFWTEAGRPLAFEAGWWSVGVWAALVAGFATTALAMVKARSEGVIGVVFVAGPTAAVVIFGLLNQFADPNPGCTYDCQGRLVLIGVACGTLVGWGLGFVTGALLRWAQRQRTD